MADVSTLAAGLASGLATGLVAAGAAVVARATRTLHLAVGPIAVTGLLMHLGLNAVPLNVPAPLSLAAGIAVAVMLSMLLEPLVLAPLPDGLPRLAGLVAAGAIVAAGTGRLLGARTLRPAPLLDLPDVTVGGAIVGGEVLTAGAVGIPAAVLLAWAARSSTWGRRLRLVGAEPRAAARIGISPRRVRLGALAVSGAAGTLAMVAVAPVTFAGLPQAPRLTLAAVAAVVLAEDRPDRAVLVGVGLGVVEALGQSWWPAAGGEVLSGAVLVLALLWRGGEHVRAWGRTW